MEVEKGRFIGYIYKIIHNETGKCYIGKTKNDPHRRYSCHFSNSGAFKGENSRDYSFVILAIIKTKKTMNYNELCNKGKTILSNLELFFIASEKESNLINTRGKVLGSAFNTIPFMNGFYIVENKTIITNHLLNRIDDIFSNKFYDYYKPKSMKTKEIKEVEKETHFQIYKLNLSIGEDRPPWFDKWYKSYPDFKTAWANLPSICNCCFDWAVFIAEKLLVDEDLVRYAVAMQAKEVSKHFEDLRSIRFMDYVLKHKGKKGKKYDKLLTLAEEAYDEGKVGSLVAISIHECPNALSYDIMCMLGFGQLQSNKKAKKISSKIDKITKDMLEIHIFNKMGI